jgi:hypothetical protein
MSLVVGHLKWGDDETRLLGYIPKKKVEAFIKEYEDCIVAKVTDGRYTLELFAIRLVSSVNASLPKKGSEKPVAQAKEEKSENEKK